MLKIYNSLTRKKEELKPIHNKKIGIYVCGMTVYDLCHIGHARVMIVFDSVVRYLRSLGFNVHYVRNITDIDDKIIDRAKQQNIPFHILTENNITAMHEDFSALNLLPPDEEPKATAFIPEIIQMIATLIKNNFAYVADNGDVCYDIKQFKDYGKLSHKDLEGLRAGARVDVLEGKRDPLDFVLWKKAKSGEPSWDSPWGKGRPGWHIECSAMSTKCLGAHFDIHGGGFDLQFPHHENEIAQSEGATGKKFVNIWMHAGFLQIDKTKMSKSLGNFFTIRDVLKDYSGEVIRFFMISSHYRHPINYSQQSLDLAIASLKTLYLALRGLTINTDQIDDHYQKNFQAAMDDDFNTPLALSILFEIAHEINRSRENDMKRCIVLANTLRQLGNIFGILQQDVEKFLVGRMDADEMAAIKKLIADRDQARKEKDWAEADRIRDQLKAMGIIIEDSAQGTSWRRV